MENIMKEMLVSGLQAKVDNETFVKRIARLLSDSRLKLLCTGVPVKILTCDLDKAQAIIEREVRDKQVEAKRAILMNDSVYPVSIEYTYSIVKYFVSKEEAEEAAKRGDTLAGKVYSSELYSVGHGIRCTNRIGLTMAQANACCTFEWL